MPLRGLAIAASTGWGSRRLLAELQDMDTPYPTPNLMPRYEIKEALGHGAFGVVYHAIAHPLKVPCAVKVLRVERAASAKLMEGLRREAKAALAVESLHVAQFREFGETPDGQAYVVFELCRGESLSDVLKRGPLSPPQAVTILKQLAEGLQAIHAAGIVHRDLKPSNIMVEQRKAGPFVKILDFGIAHLEEPSPDDETAITLMGACTPNYAPPEYHTAEGRDRGMSNAFDIFSLGTIAYEMLGGRKAYHGRTTTEILLKVQEGKPDTLAEFEAKLAAAPTLLKAVLSAMAHDQEKRPSDLRHWSRMLDQGLVEWNAESSLPTQELAPVASKAPPSTPPQGAKSAKPAVPSEPSRERSEAPRSSGRWALAGVVAALVCGFLAWMILREPDQAQRSDEEASASAAPEAPPVKLPEWAEVVEAPEGLAALPSSPWPRKLKDSRTGIHLLLVPAGSVRIGVESGLFPDEGPVREVVITQPFYLGATEVTRQEWRKLMGNDAPGARSEDDAQLPICDVSRQEVLQFMEKSGYVLPTEAQWEHAARAGRKGVLESAKLTSEAWFRDNSSERLHAVGQKKANPWGLSDMMGNVWEWCEDGYSEFFLEEMLDGARDPKGPAKAARFSQRGGSARDDSPRVTWSSRASGKSDSRDGFLGFRVALSLEDQ